ncbi:MAG: DUF2065 domain-containing protein [Pseudomonadota bacterium]
MADAFPIWTLILFGIGIWFLVEGAMYALAPDAMRRFLAWAAAMPVPDLRSAGLWTAAFGALLLYIGVRLI